ncbi:MAG: GldG family protein [Verrucomicrobiales bacterium]|jgi:ABC-type uncharacterized transport system involved in gliding motility auxiliary subunit|nr:GldG family protein [Verrucomicrobiales bacterium]
MSGGPQPGKWRWKFNLLAGGLLVLVLYLGVNGIALRHYWRQNVLLGAAYTKVSGQTINLLRGLIEPLTITNYVSDASDPAVALIRRDVAALLEEYEYHGGQGKASVSVRTVDPYLHFAAARKLAEEYKLTTQENVLIVSYQGRHRVLSYSELAEVDTSQLPFTGAARLVSFKAEEALGAAIQALAQGRQTRVYFLSGHGEYNPDTADSDNLGYSVLRSYLERQNSAVARLALAELPQVPEDADLLIVAGPKSKYLDYEITVLKNYTQEGTRGQGGRLVLMLDPATDSGLEDFAAEYGVNFRNDMVMAKFATLGQTKVLPDAVASIYAEHPAVEWLRRAGLSLRLDRMRSLSVGGETEQARSAIITPLMKTGEMFWGETEFKTPALEFVAARDFAGPLNVAVAIDTASVSGGEVRLRGTKMALLGGGQFLTNQLLGPEQVDFFINLTNWMLEGGKPLGLAPKTPKEFTVALTPRQTTTLTLTLLLVPAAGLATALLVWWKRRS